MAQDDPRIDHVGLALWAAAQAWRARLTAEMAARGVNWCGEARAALIPLIPPEGVRLPELCALSGLSRQATHQLVLALEAEGMVLRAPDPGDRRARVVRFTEAGMQVQRLAAEAKRAIEADYAARLGGARLRGLREGLAALARL
jgi:DNA-binding MarR family transcriptional regulator